MLRRRRRSRVPRGAVAAVLIVGLTHALVARFVYPDPLPRRDVRRKLIALTGEISPKLIIAGDSRAECGLVPAIVAERMGVNTRAAINMAAPACDLPGVLAGFREFRERLDARPIVVISVSVVDLNDRVDERLIGDETLWSLSLGERIALVSPKRALLATFLPEREFVRRRLLEPMLLGNEARLNVAEQGYRGEESRHVYPPEKLARELEGLDRAWYNGADFAGARWRLFCESVQAMVDDGAQVVLLDPPAHPDFVAGIAGTRMGSADRLFHRQLAEFCHVQGIPLLRYSAEDLCRGEACVSDPGSSFVSLMHLNRAGAGRVSALVGDALADLAGRGELH